ncbi:MAG: hypothetical protein ABFD69_10285 [Candidatus Sumerlaeia bacterium]
MGDAVGVIDGDGAGDASHMSHIAIMLTARGKSNYLANIINRTGFIAVAVNAYRNIHH